MGVVAYFPDCNGDGYKDWKFCSGKFLFRMTREFDFKLIVDFVTTQILSTFSINIRVH